MRVQNAASLLAVFCGEVFAPEAATTRKRETANRKLGSDQRRRRPTSMLRGTVIRGINSGNPIPWYKEREHGGRERLAKSVVWRLHRSEPGQGRGVGGPRCPSSKQTMSLRERPRILFWRADS